MSLKILLLGESGSGKTCSLASLAAAGYNLRILDVDNNIQGLRNIISSPKSQYPKECAERIAHITLTDMMRVAGGRIIPAKASMWTTATAMLDNWKNEDPLRGTVCNLGKLTTWTDKDVLVIDTLSALGQGAMNFHLQMNGVLGAIRTGNEGRRDIGGAQSLIRLLMQLLNDKSILCHVIVLTHITYVRADGSGNLMLGDNPENVQVQGFPNAIGRAISPEIPRYFGTILKCETVGSGMAVKRSIHTIARGNINLKNIAPMSVKAEYPQETGLADYFRDALEASK